MNSSLHLILILLAVAVGVVVLFRILRRYAIREICLPTLRMSISPLNA